MKIRSIKLPRQLDKTLYERAESRGVSSSAVMREALAAYLGDTIPRRPNEPMSVAEMAADLMGCVTGPSNLASGVAHMAGYGQSRPVKR